MREILFRGKTKESDHFIFGYVYKMRDKYYILNKNFETEGSVILDIIYEVIPETVGQFTGLTDKNGVKIFEGDKVRILYTDWVSKSDNDSRTLSQYLIDISKTGEVVFAQNEWNIRFYSEKFKEFFLGCIESGKHGFIEVIGNIHTV